MRRLLVLTILAVMHGGVASAQDDGGEPGAMASLSSLLAAMFGPPPSPVGPSPFAAPGSDLGLSGFGYYYDEPTERLLRATDGGRDVRVTGSVSSPASMVGGSPRRTRSYGPGEWVSLR